jgi:hypothetical protein
MAWPPRSLAPPAARDRREGAKPERRNLHWIQDWFIPVEYLRADQTGRRHCHPDFGEDPSTQAVVDRLAQNVGNGEGLVDYPELKTHSGLCRATTPSDLTLVEIKRFRAIS